jgi:hypothetical protein
LIRVEARGHQLGADTHDPAHQSAHAKTLLTRRRLSDSIRTWYLVDERSNLAGRAVLEKESQNDPDRLFSHAPIDADVRDKPIEKFIHHPTPSTALTADWPNH